jgi:hypothetical protein
MMFMRGERNPDYTPAQRWLSERVSAALPSIADDLSAAAAADEVVVLRFLDDGTDPQGAMRVRLVPRAELAGRGEPRFDVPAPVAPGERGACWILAGQEGLRATVCIRLGQMPLDRGGHA